MLFEESRKHFPGGVNSPVRYYEPSPVFIRSGKGSKICDTQGKTYIDYCLGYGPLILGHSNEQFNSALKERIESGILFGSPTEEEIRLASIITSAIPSIEKMRFTNSGTEATMHAIRLARAFTKRKYILKMEGGYHGAHDYSLIRSGSGTLTFGTPSSPGVPEEITETVLLGHYNDIESIRGAFSRFKGQIAAVITEPVLGNTGVVPPFDGFLQELREITEYHSSLLIFDEVITGFRFGYHGYQDMIQVKPDLTTLGKIIGGGLPIGLFGGRADIMDMISPSGDVYEAGTFSGNPLSVTGGITALELLRGRDYGYINDLTARLVSGISDIAEDSGEDININRVSSMFQLFFNKNPVRTYPEATASDSRKFGEMFRKLLERGVFLPPSQFETNFLSFAHTREDVDSTLEAFKYVWK